VVAVVGPLLSIPSASPASQDEQAGHACQENRSGLGHGESCRERRSGRPEVALPEKEIEAIDLGIPVAIGFDLES